MTVNKNPSSLSLNANSEDTVLIRLCFVWSYKQGSLPALFQTAQSANTRLFALTIFSFIKCITQPGEKAPDFTQGSSPKLKFNWAPAVAVQH